MKPTKLLLPLCGLLALTAPMPVFASALLKPTSGVTQALTAKSLVIETHLRGAFAKTTLTTTYSNPNNEPIEADFLYSAPKGSVVTGFAYWYGKEKVVARVVEKGRAAKIYQYITSRMRDPALVEMVGKNAFRARIFPVEARTDLKIEIQLAQTLPQTQNGPLWTYPLREETQNGALQDVKIHLQSSGNASSNLGAFKNGELRFEKRNFKAKDDARALVTQNPAPIRASLVAARDGGSDGFFALSLTPNSPVVRPVVKISGVATYQVLAPQMTRIAAGQAFVVVGRYRGSGRAVVALNGQSFQVDFPDSVEKNNLASLLWAAERIENLSENPRNQALVMELSKRFGVPSKWTSWLAIPEAERRNFKRQMWAADRADAARAYAQALSRGDSGGANSQKIAFEALTEKLKADGSNYAENEELQPLSSYLNDELRRLQKAVVQAKYDAKISKNQRAQWQLWAKNLQKAGADDGGKGVDLPVYVIEDELRIASRLWLQEVEIGRAKGTPARRLQARLKELGQTKTARDYGWDETTFLHEAAGVRANALAMDIATSRASDKPNRNRELQAQARLNRLAKSTEIDAQSSLQEALQTVWGAKVEAASQKWAHEIEAGRVDSASAQKFAREVRALQKRSGLKRIHTVDTAWQNLANQTALRAAPAIQTQGPNGVAAKQLETQIGVLAKRAEKPHNEFLRSAWSEIGSSVASQLASEIREERAEGEKARQLQFQLSAIEKSHKIDYSSTVQSAWDEVERKTAEELAVEIRAKRENSAKAEQLSKKLKEISLRSSTRSEWITRNAWHQRATETLTEKLEEIAQNGPDSPRAQQLKTQSEEFALKAKTETSRLSANVGVKLLESYNSQIGDEIASKRENGPKIEAVRLKRARLIAEVPALKNYEPHGVFSQNFAWEARAHESAYRLLEAQQKGETEKVAPLQEELDLAVKNAKKSRDAVLQWEKANLGRNVPLVSATDYRVRPGDPLISVLAPANCRQVVAIMPDGTLLPLRYDAAKKAWEARFDVPMWASEGDYRVQILIVSPEGARQKLTMNFALDVSAPQGVGSIHGEEKSWHLRLETDEKSDRVSAFTPWNERVEMRRNENGVFAAQVEVPAAFIDQKAAVRFVLTDKAHNRTEIVVDWK